MIRHGCFHVEGDAAAPALVLAEALSFWGGVDATTGAIIDRSHPNCGRNLTGRILVMPGARGSSSSSSVLAEAIRLGTGPAGIVMARPDPILIVGAMVARSLYGLSCPIVVAPIDGIATGDLIRIARSETGEAAIFLSQQSLSVARRSS